MKVFAGFPGRARRSCAGALAAMCLIAATPMASAQDSTPTAAGYTPAGGLITAVFIGSFPIPEIETLEQVLFKGYTTPPPRYPVDTYRIRFGSADFDGSGAVITAELFVPRYTARTERPVLVFGSGTTGIGDACAPSLEQWEVRHFGDYRANMLAYAGQGFIVVFPDYLGFNDPDRPQRYFSKLAEGHVMLDSARAVFQYFRTGRQVVEPLPKVFVAGYSQGGHAAFAAADLWKSYAPDVPLAGAIGFGGATDVETLLREGPAYAPLIFYTYSVMYGSGDVDPAALLQDRFVKTLAADVNTLCIDQFQTYYGYDGSKLYRPEFHRALYARELAANYPSLARRLAENGTGLDGHGLPALVLDGGTDFIVTPASHLRFVEALRKAGSRVRCLAYQGVPHKGIRQAGFQESVDWMEQISRGEPAPEN